MGRIHIQKWLILLLVLMSQSSSSWGSWFSKFVSNNENDKKLEQTSSGEYSSFNFEPEFSMEVFQNDAKEPKVIEYAQQQVSVPNSCWQRAYKSLYTSCSKALLNEELSGRLAWNLCECFQQYSGRSPMPTCDANSSMTECLHQLDSDVQQNYLDFFLHTRGFCYQLEAEAWKHETERLVNDLKSSAGFAEKKLDDILKAEESILKNSKYVKESLASIDDRTEKVAHTSKNVEDRVNSVFIQSHAILVQSKGIAASQLELSKGQANMNETMHANMAMLHESFTNLDNGISGLRTKTEGVEKEIVKVGNEMTSNMNNLHSKADDIGSIVGESLDKQKQLLDEQNKALDGLKLFTETQSQALEKNSFLAQLGYEQQEELLRGQEQLQKTHDLLFEKSKTILVTQETFESKQAGMLHTMDKMFSLLSAIFLESRSIKASLVYLLLIFLLYMFTSTKQTYNVRSRLYMGLCLTLLIEVAIIRYETNQIDIQAWNVNIVRSLFVLLASYQILYAICTYRDYEALNHQMLQTLVEKVNGIQRQWEYLLWELENDDSDDEVQWSSWIETELPEDIDKLKDPDFVLLEVGENSVGSKLTTGRYNLRNRNLLTYR